MNERIVDTLVRKAKEIAITDTSDGGKHFDLDLFHRKFAELIVQECADTVMREGNEVADSMSKITATNYIDVAEKVGMINAAMIHSGKIKQHFGIE